MIKKEAIVSDSWIDAYEASLLDFITIGMKTYV
jgi:hypothetical protein